MFDGQGFVAQREDSASGLGKDDEKPARQWGHHPTSPAVRHYFDDPSDDPGLIERMFVLPPVESSARQRAGSESGGGWGLHEGGSEPAIHNGSSDELRASHALEVERG